MKLDSYEDVEPFLKSFETESDRACAVLAGVLLDELLKHLLQRVMIEDAPAKIFEYPGAFSSFSAKIDAAFYFGHLSSDEYEEMGRIRKIRNEFAHQLDPGLTFASRSIHKFARELKLPAIYVAIIGLQSKQTPMEMQQLMEDPRKAFVLSTSVMAGFIQQRAREYERPEPRSCFQENISMATSMAKRKWDFWDVVTPADLKAACGKREQQGQGADGP